MLRTVKLYNLVQISYDLVKLEAVDVEELAAISLCKINADSIFK